MDYHYSKELPQPFRISKSRLHPPAARFLAKIKNSRTKRQEATALPPGISATAYLLSANGQTFRCECIEPAEEEGSLPAILYLHGHFSLPQQEHYSLEIAGSYAKNLQSRVFLVKFPLLFMDPFPAGLEESYAALRFIIEFHERLKVDASQILIYGDSAGGMLAASLTRYYLDQHQMPKLAGLALVYPALDNSKEYYSKRQYAQAVWPLQLNQKMWGRYLTSQSRQSSLAQYAVPGKNLNFRGFPPVYIESLEKDILRDEALKYGRELRKAGIWTYCEYVKGAYHAYDCHPSSRLVRRVLKTRVKIFRSFLSIG